MNRSEAIAANIARAIVRNTKRRFSRLHADALEEIRMSELMNGMTVSENSAVPNPTATKVDHKNLVTGENYIPSGDTAASSLAEASDNGGPRNPMGQFDDPPSVTSKLHGAGSAESQ
jgi:hypothetical protein